MFPMYWSDGKSTPAYMRNLAATNDAAAVKLLRKHGADVRTPEGYWWVTTPEGIPVGGVHVRNFKSDTPAGYRRHVAAAKMPWTGSRA